MAKKKSATKKEAPAEAKPKVIKKIAKDKKNIFKQLAEDVKKPSFLVAILAEFIGSFLLCSVVSTMGFDPLVIFFTLIPLTIFAYKISGANINPIITLGACATKRISVSKAIVYIVAQFVGAVVAMATISSFVTNINNINTNGVAQQNQASLYSQEDQNKVKTFQIPEVSVKDETQAKGTSKELTLIMMEFLGALLFAFLFASMTSKKQKNSLAEVALGVAGSLSVISFIFVKLAQSTSVANSAQAKAVFNPFIAFITQAPFNENGILSTQVAVYGIAPIIGGIIGFALQLLIEKAQDEQ